MTDYAFPQPSTTEAPNTEGGEIHFDTHPTTGQVTGVTVKLGEHDCAILGIDDGWVRIADLSRDRLTAREAVFLGWALTALAANEEVRW